MPTAGRWCVGVNPPATVREMPRWEWETEPPAPAVIVRPGYRIAISDIGPPTRIVGLAWGPEYAPGPVPIQMPTAQPAAGVTIGVREAPTSNQPEAGEIDDSAGPWKPNGTKG